MPSKPYQSRQLRATWYFVEDWSQRFWNPFIPMRSSPFAPLRKNLLTESPHPSDMECTETVTMTELLHLKNSGCWDRWSCAGESGSVWRIWQSLVGLVLIWIYAGNQNKTISIFKNDPRNQDLLIFSEIKTWKKKRNPAKAIKLMISPIHIHLFNLSFPGTALVPVPKSSSQKKLGTHQSPLMRTSPTLPETAWSMPTCSVKDHAGLGGEEGWVVERVSPNQRFQQLWFLDELWHRDCSCMCLRWNDDNHVASINHINKLMGK